MSVMNIGTRYAWVILFGGATSWEKGKSTREQTLVSDTAVLELGTYSIIFLFQTYQMLNLSLYYIHAFNEN